MCWGYFNLQDGDTALYVAAYNCRTEIVTALLAKGASTDIQNKVRIYIIRKYIFIMLNIQNKISF